MNSMKKGKPYSLPKRKSFKSQAHEDAEQVVKTKGCWDRIHAYSGPEFSLAFLGGWVKKKSENLSLSHLQLFETPQTVAHQAPLPVGFSRQEYKSG